MYIESIKKIIVGYLNNLKTTQVLSGTVESINPLAIRISKELVIPSELISGELKRFIIKSWQVGMKLNLIRNEGGQEFVILEEITNIPSISVGTITAVNPLVMEIGEGPLKLVEERIIGNQKANYNKIEDIGKKVRLLKNSASLHFYILEEVIEDAS
ncbi:hypothetical protein CS063_01565 [Sporanaerobium hydrogeniformans]|uniref:Uncharacterized protein n=1 Tax=Sporanaerobium hydrogeniformans TaxID=3072179 RepID=A0AC61DG30_9FIRM|nr:hypothetical protein [Sporanaerobium hydrogeniformans]PHV72189.1 hypothetical protein CS063_01565 [Sporanaerobium hydrogeniformans]